MLRKTIAVLFCFFFGSIAYSQQSTLSKAIKDSVLKIESEIVAGQKVAVLNFITESPDLSDHIVNEIMNIVINGKKLSVVERSRIDAILAERGIQVSGEVNDAQIASIGNFDGAQFVITGSLKFVASSYRFNLYVLDMTRGVRMASSIIQVRRNDADIAFFMGGAPSPNRRNEIDTWENRRAYIGGWGGYGSWYDGYVFDDPIGTGPSAYYGGLIGFKAELCVTEYFSLDFDMGLEIGVTGLGVVTPCGTLFAHIPFRLESGLDIGILGGIFGGDPYFFGAGGGASLGYKMETGILFLEAIYLRSFLNEDYHEYTDNGYVLRVGYKVGIGKREQ